ncbi:MAG: DNA-binding protein WhiA [Actinobacteria bacterium]|nr:DNA-binding protein WhiA [Actinomycetota bacterium]
MATTSAVCSLSRARISLSEDLRAELAAIDPASDCDRLAELSGLFHSAGSVHLRGRGEVSVHLDLSSPAVSRRAFALLRGFGVASQIRTYRRRAFGRETRYQLHVEGDARALQVLHEAGILSAGLAPLPRPPRRLLSRACCRAAYLRGALLGAGSLSGPRSPHLEVRSETAEAAEFVSAIAAAEGTPLATVDRGRHVAAYAKGAEPISALLAVAGASNAVLLLQERSVVGATRARANRLANADHANLVRTGRAAHRQLRAARRLRDSGRLAELPRELREVAELRLRHPSMSLRELGGKCEPATSKVTVQRRLQAIIRLVEP